LPDFNQTLLDFFNLVGSLNHSHAAVCARSENDFSDAGYYLHAWGRIMAMGYIN